ncbi:MAG: hypothetical protein ACO1OF_14025 [Adhaeribacter sp.]
MQIINNVLLLSYSDLIDTYGLSRGTVDAGINKFCTGKSNSWASIKDPQDKRRRLIVYRTIPAYSLKNLPSESELIKKCQQQEAERENIKELIQG